MTKKFRQMKKVLRMFFAFLAMSSLVILPTSCEEEEDDNNSTNNGTNDSSNGNSTNNSVNNGQLSELIGKNFTFKNEDGSNSFFTLNADGIWTKYVWGGEDDNVYAEESKGSFTISKDGSSIVITDQDGVTVTYKIENKDGKYTFGNDALKETFSESNETYDALVNDYNDWKAKVDEMVDVEKVKENGVAMLAPVLKNYKYSAYNETKDIKFKFTVVDATGHFKDKDQVVTISINGAEYTLSDQKGSYLMYVDGAFKVVTMMDASQNASCVVMCLALNSANVDYTIISGSNHSTLKTNGATETKFLID